MAPFITIITGFKESPIYIFNPFEKKINNLLKNFFLSITFIQLMMFLISCFYSLLLVSYVVYDYEKGMNKTAYNFYNSQKIQKMASMPVFNEVTGTTQLYFDSDSIANHKFNKCFFYDENIENTNKYAFCMNKLGINTIIVKKNRLDKNDIFNCKSDYLIRASRNIFLEKKIDVDFCELKK